MATTDPWTLHAPLPIPPSDWGYTLAETQVHPSLIFFFMQFSARFVNASYCHRYPNYFANSWRMAQNQCPAPERVSLRVANSVSFPFVPILWSSICHCLSSSYHHSNQIQNVQIWQMERKWRFDSGKKKEKRFYSAFLWAFVSFSQVSTSSNFNWSISL